jgi:hypothetical protein
VCSEGTRPVTKLVVFPLWGSPNAVLAVILRFKWSRTGHDRSLGSGVTRVRMTSIARSRDIFPVCTSRKMASF